MHQEEDDGHESRTRSLTNVGLGNTRRTSGKKVPIQMRKVRGKTRHIWGKLLDPWGEKK